MLSEKFFLMLEMLRLRNYPDGGPRVVSTSPHVPVKLPTSDRATVAKLPTSPRWTALTSTPTRLFLILPSPSA